MARKGSGKIRERVLITGANGTLGKALAKEFEKRGYIVLPITRKQYDLSEKGIGEKICRGIGPIDILVNNAGTLVTGEFVETPLEKELELIKVNINAATELCKAYAKEMKKRGKGKILNISSMMAFRNGKGVAVYAASKAFILSFSQSLEAELKKYGITVSAMCPAAFESGMTSNKRTLTAETVAKNAVDGLLSKKTVIRSEFTLPMQELYAKATGKWKSR